MYINSLGGLNGSYLHKNFRNMTEAQWRAAVKSQREKEYAQDAANDLIEMDESKVISSDDADQAWAKVEAIINK